MIQLNPPIPVKTPKGKAMAHVLIDYGPDYDLMWVTFQDDTGECWTWQNKDIRGQENITLDRIPLRMSAYDIHEEMRKRNAEIARLEMQLKEVSYPERKDVQTS